MVRARAGHDAQALQQSGSKLQGCGNGHTWSNGLKYCKLLDVSIGGQVYTQKRWSRSNLSSIRPVYTVTSCMTEVL